MSSANNNKEEDDNASCGMSSLSSTTMKNTSPNDNIINTITRVSDHNVAAADTEPAHTPQPPPIIVSAPIINDCNNNNNPPMHYNDYNNMPHNNIMSVPQYNATVTLHNNNINNIAVPSTAAPQQQTTHAPSSSYVMSSENNNINHLPSDNVNINMPIEASAYHTYPPQVTTSNPLNAQTRDGSIDHFASAANEHIKQPAFQAANNGSENLHQQHSSTSAIDQLLTLDMRSYQNLEDAIIQVKSYLENVRQLAYQNPALSSSTTRKEGGELSFYDMIENTGVGGKERSLFVTIITGEGGVSTHVGYVYCIQYCYTSIVPNEFVPVSPPKKINCIEIIRVVQSYVPFYTRFFIIVRFGV